MGLRKMAIREIRGKTIKSVIVTEYNPHFPFNQVYLVFTDGTYYEFNGEVHSSGSIHHGDTESTLHFAEQSPGVTTKVC